jgi:hypothetical protein
VAKHSHSSLELFARDCASFALVAIPAGAGYHVKGKCRHSGKQSSQLEIEP